MDTQQEELRRRLVALGFDEVRFARFETAPAGGLDRWLARGFQADMTWLERTAAKRQDPRLVLPGVRSIIALGVNYWPGESATSGQRSEISGPKGGGEGPGTESRGAAESGWPVWARYALYEDYHDTIKPALVAAGKLLEELYGVDGRGYRYYVDTGPVMERGWAERSGIGFLGKNGMLISRKSGNWLLLAAILTAVDFAADAPLASPPRLAAAGDRTGLLCGRCTRCLEACPTQAIPHPGQVDSRRCISYQTIENKGLIPRALRPGIGGHIYGCDVCLEVCPWNRFARAGRRMLLAARTEAAELDLRALLELTPTRFAESFRGTPIKRLKLAGLLRNACVVAGNLAAKAGEAHEWIQPLVRLAAHPVPVVRVHAVWGVYRIAGGPAASRLLATARARETDPAVGAEYAACERETGAT